MNRNEQLAAFRQLLSLARGLNHGSNVTDKILELERLACQLSLHDFSGPVAPSFVSWVEGKVATDNEKDVEGNLPPPLTPVAWYHQDFGEVELSRVRRAGWLPLFLEGRIQTLEWSDKKPDDVGWWWEWTGDIADAPEVVCVVSVEPLEGFYRNQKGRQLMDGGPFYSGPIPLPNPAGESPINPT